ncbi:hypothetical protein SO694_000313102 [Aureococcus anophagefferens]|uniref:CCD97-like C-terminal domain-containing protein n=1 Tax=Aureococcus anophagefferens TaxID=44056 RepID=A0ABR1FJQ4_AURAN
MAAHVANINDSETHSDEDESDGGLDDLLGIGSLDCASESEEDEAPLFARRDADLGALLDADRYFAVHRFVFERQKYDKPGIFEADLTGDCAAAPPRLVRLLKRFGAEVADAAARAARGARGDQGAAQRRRRVPGALRQRGPPSKRAVTAVLYFGAEAGGDLVLAPFLGAASPYRRGGTASRSSARTACSTG